jgi:lipopolysaccharide biosynthesis glycosyltransferase
MMQNKQNILITMAFDDRFFAGGLTHIFSLKKHLRDFDSYHFKLLTNERVCKLSDVHKQQILKIVPHMEFEEIIQPAYSNCKVMYETHRACFMAFEVFRQQGYDKVVYMDADLLCLKDISNMIEDAPLDRISACTGGDLGANTSLFVIGKDWKINNPNIYDQFIDKISNTNTVFRINDQQVMNEVLGGTYNNIPEIYNWAYNYSNSGEIPTGTCILSWSGALPPPGRKMMVKPWETVMNNEQYSLDGSLFNNLWKEYNNELNQL